VRSGVRNLAPAPPWRCASIADGEGAECPVPPDVGRRRRPVDYYPPSFASPFLKVGLASWLRRHRGPRAAIPFALHCSRCPLPGAFPDRSRRDARPGGLLGHLVGLLLAPALFIHVNIALTDEDRGAAGWRFGRALLYLAPLGLFLCNIYLIPLGGAYRFADPVASIRWKERLEQLYVAVYLISGIVMAVRSYLSAEKAADAVGSSNGWPGQRLRLPAGGALLSRPAVARHPGRDLERAVRPFDGPRAADLRRGQSSTTVCSTSTFFVKRGTVAIGLLLTAAANLRGLFTW